MFTIICYQYVRFNNSYNLQYILYDSEDSYKLWFTSYNIITKSILGM